MLCSKPIPIRHKTVNNQDTGLVKQVKCRKCLPCRITRRKEWTARILLESILHDESIFITLTYDDEHLPGIDIHPGGTLHKQDLQIFLKRLRNKGLKFRYLAVGEYGEKFERAHYHAIIFGLGLEAEQSVAQAWEHGFVHVREFNYQRAQYTAGYTVKKLTGEKEAEYLQGRKPEFLTSSRKPGIGYEAAELIGETMLHDKARTRLFYGNAIRMQGRILPLDTYMLDAINEYLDKHIGHGTPKDTPALRTTQSVYDRADLHDQSDKKATALQRKSKLNKKRVATKYTA